MSEMMIRELPETERPRERLLEYGGRALSDSELLAVLLRTGREGASALTIARELLREHGGLAGLATAPPEALRRGGIGPAKAASLLAALEVGRRLARAELEDRDLLTRPAETARYLALRYHGRHQEVMGALFLDVRNRLLGERELFRGSLDRTAVDSREVLKEALLRGATSIILFHTHPSGDPTPSSEDITFTRQLARAAQLMGLRLADHVIVGGTGRWVSLHQKGAF